MPKYKFFSNTEGAAYKDSGGDIDWGKTMVQYPKKDGEYIDVKVLVDPKNGEWNKSICAHKFMRTKKSFGMPNKIQDENGNWVKNKDIKWLGTKRCLPAQDENTTSCENCKFLVQELMKIDKIVSTIFKINVEEMSPSDFSKLVKELDEKAKTSTKLKKFKGIYLKYTQLNSSIARWDKYFAVDVYGQGIQIIEAKKAFKNVIDKLWKEQKDPTNYWIRIENNQKAARGKGGNLSDYYLMYESPLNGKEGAIPPTEEQLQALHDSNIQVVYKKLLELEDPKVQLDHLNGIFDNKKDDDEEEEVGASQSNDNVEVDDADIASVADLMDDDDDDDDDSEDDKEEKVVEEDKNDDLDVGDLLDDDLDISEVDPNDKSESIPITPEEDGDDLFTDDLDDDLQDITDLLDDD